MAKYHYATLQGVKCIVCEEVNVFGAAPGGAGICPAERIILSAIKDGAKKLVAHVYGSKGKSNGASDYGWREIAIANINMANVNYNRSVPPEKQIAIPLSNMRVYTPTSDLSSEVVAPDQDTIDDRVRQLGQLAPSIAETLISDVQKQTRSKLETYIVLSEITRYINEKTRDFMVYSLHKQKQSASMGQKAGQ